MAAPSFVQAGAGTPITGASATVQIATTPAGGNLIFLDVLVDGGGTPTHGAITNLSNLSGTPGSVTLLSSYEVGSPAAAGRWLWVGRVTSTGTVSVSVNAPGTTDCYARMYEFSSVAAGATLVDIIENGSSVNPELVNNAGTGATVFDVSVGANGADRLAVNFIAVADDVTLAAYTGQTGGTWAEPVAEYADATGTQGTLGIQTAALAPSATIDGGTLTITSASWNVVGFALKPGAGGGAGEGGDPPPIARSTMRW